jgi:hypothetical protein
VSRAIQATLEFAKLFLTSFFSAELRRLLQDRAMTRGALVLPQNATTGFARSLREFVGEVASLLFGNATFEPHASFDDELRALVQPHLAILVHKRSRLLAPGPDFMARNARWVNELDGFVNRTFFWPQPAATESHGKVDRRHIARFVDGIVAEEQVRATAAPGKLPATSRFDSHWAH